MGDNWNDVKEVIVQALALPEGEREAFVAERCPDPAVRNEALELLRAKNTLSRFLSAPAFPAPIETELATGARVGTYTILDTLGQGGMGRVYLAKDSKLHRRVALKSLLSPTQSSAEDRARMLHEARTAAQINHPHIATIHEFLEVEDRAFIVMEYVEGQNLSAILRRDRLPIDRVITMARQLASGLTAAHAKGVVHRDLKPANVKLTEDGSVKILDFGVAGMTTAFTTVSGLSSVETGKGAQPGTLGYMSPEQLWSRRFDERSDIFSLGVVLFEMATGERAYPTSDELQLIEAMRRPLRRADAVDARVPRPLADVIARAVSNDPDQRFASASAVGAALGEIERTLTGVRTESRATAKSSVLANVGRWMFIALCAAAFFTALGYVSSRTFDLAIERGEFAIANPLVWMREGAQSCVPMAFIFVALLGLRALGTVLRNVVVPISRTGQTVDRIIRQRAKTLSHRLRLEDPSVLASWLLLGFVVIAAVTWWVYAPYLGALLTPISQATPAQLGWLGPTSENYRSVYQIIFTTLVVLGSLAWYRLGPKLLVAGGASNRALVAGGVAMIVAALVSIELQYQFFLERSKLPIAEIGEAKCFVTAQRGNDARVYCPGERDRVRAISNANENLKMTGKTGSVFAPIPN